MFREIIIALAIVTVFAFLATPVSAGMLKGDIVKGPIVAIDVEKGEMTVDDSRSGQRLTYKVAPDVAASYQKGQIVIIRAKEGSDVAQSVKLARRQR